MIFIDQSLIRKIKEDTVLGVEWRTLGVNGLTAAAE